MTLNDIFLIGKKIAVGILVFLVPLAIFMVTIYLVQYFLK